MHQAYCSGVELVVEQLRGGELFLMMLNDCIWTQPGLCELSRKAEPGQPGQHLPDTPAHSLCRPVSLFHDTQDAHNDT
jgi:hypothetical protein